MKTNMTITATFMSSPFIAWAGTYQGLFCNSNGVDQQSSGFITLTVRKNGAYSGKLRQGTGSHPFSGRFSVSGAAFCAWSRTNAIILNIGDDDVLTGQISGAFAADVIANRTVYTSKNKAPQSADKYTMVLSPSTNIDVSVQPAGYGFGTVKVSSLGSVSFKGVLGEGTVVSSSAAVSKNGDWPFYAAYAGGGTLIGWLNFTNNSFYGDVITGNLIWMKAAQPKRKLYPNAFTNDTQVVGTAYRFTKKLPSWYDFIGYDVQLNNGNLDQLIDSQFTFRSDSKYINAEKKSLNITTSTGRFTGSVINPATGKPLPFKGVLLQNADVAGCGTFLGTNQSGSVLIQDISQDAPMMGVIFTEGPTIDIFSGTIPSDDETP